MLKNIDNSSLEELEMEIEDFIFEKKHSNYEDEEVEYLFEFIGFSEINF